MSISARRSPSFMGAVILTLLGASCLSAVDYPADTWVDITPSLINKSDPGSFGCNDIQIDPGNPNVLYACWDEKAISTGGSRVTKSTDGGATWAKLGNIAFESPVHLRINPSNTQHLYLVAGVRQPDTWGLWESTNGGTTWAPPAGYADIVNDPRIKFSDAKFRNDLYDIQLNPSDPSHLLVSFHGSWTDTGSVSNVDDQRSGVIERLNGSWRVAMPDVGMKGVGFRCAFLNNSSTWLMGTQASGFWRTTNSGANWSKVYTAHMCHGGMQMTSRDGAFLVGSLDGVIRSTDNGATWAKVNGLTNEQSYAVVQGAGKFYTIPGFWAGGSSKTSYSSTDGVNWTSMGGRQFSPGMYNGVFDTTNNILFAAVWQDGLWARKVSGGSTPPATVAPTISSQPTSATVTPGQTATFRVTANGTPAPTYQWKKGGTNISGATSASYTTPATVSGDNGAVFTVVVTNSAGNVTSNGATLTVQTAAAVAPTVSSQPANATVTAGQTVTFSVTANGTPAPTYQWKKGGADITGATSASYTTPATTTGDTGSLFTVAVTNTAGSATSSAATLTVNAAPAGGGGGNTVGTYNPSAYGPYWYRRDQAKADGWRELSTPILTLMKAEHPGDESGHYWVTNLTLATNGDLLLTTVFGVMRSRDRGTTWTRLDSGTKDTRVSRGTGYPETQGGICIDPEDSNRIAYLMLRGTSYYINGTSSQQLSHPGDGFDYGSADWTSANPQLFAGTLHGTWVLGITRDAGATWDAQDNRITGTGELGPGAGASMVCVVDANVMLYNNGTGNDKPSGVFRSTDQGRNWTKVYDGQGDVGKSPVALRDGRVYFTGSNGLLISRDKGVTWTKRTAPLGLQGPMLFGDWTGGKVGGMLIKSHERVCYSKDEGVTWMDLIGGNSGNAWPVKYQKNQNGDGDLYGAVATNWVYNADNCDYRYGGSWSFDPQNNIIYADCLGGPTIWKQLPGAGPGPAPAPGGGGGTVSNVAPSIGTQPVSVTVAAGATATFSVSASGTPAPTYQWKKAGVAISSATGSSYTTPATIAGDTGSVFIVTVTNSEGNVTSTGATLTVTTVAPPVVVAPVITTQPANVTVTAGATVTFSVVASGSAPLTYQWKKGGVNISGATSETYTTPVTVIGDSGSVFTVVVTNSAGTVTSTNATLTVSATAVVPTITTQPANVTVTVGATATFSVVAMGTAPLTYQWKKGGVNIVGATSATYTTPATVIGDSGAVFTVVVTNSAGTVTSAAAILSVTDGGTLDITPPETPAAPTVSGNSASAPVLSGITEPGATVRLREGGSVVGTAVANGSGEWTITVSGLNVGSHVLTVSATDTAGNASATSPSVTVTMTAASDPMSPAPGGDSSGGCGIGSGIAMLFALLSMGFLSMGSCAMKQRRS